MNNNILKICVLLLTVTQTFAQTTFTGLGANDSGGTGFKSITNISEIVVSNNMDHFGTEIFGTGSGGGTEVLTLKADNVDAGAFDLDDIMVSNFTGSNTFPGTTLELIDANGDSIKTMSGTTALTSTPVSISSFFTTNNSLPVTGVAQIIITVVSSSSTSNFTLKSISYSNPTTPDSSPPVAQSIVLQGTPTGNATSITKRITFDENATNVSTDDFTITPTGTATGTIASVTTITANTVFDILINSISGNGTLRLDLKGTTDIIDDAGNGNGTNGTVAAFTTGSTHTVDTAPPTGYSVTIDQSPINSTNQNSTSFTFSSAEVGATYNYTLSSTGGGTNVTGSGTITSAGQTISGIDLSGLGDGTITLNATLTDTAGNTGSTATDTETKETVAPTGYSVVIDQSPINSGNQSNTSYTFSSAEIGATYNYTFSSTGGGTNVTGSGTVASSGATISGINLSGLGDGTITLSVTLTDVNGNIGSAATDTETKETVAPTGYSVVIDQSPINSGNQSSTSYTFSSAEVGATYNYTFSSTGGGTNVTGSGIIASSGATISGINLSGLGDGTITLSVTLTDVNGNTGSAATDTETKEIVAPTGYSVTIDQSPINSGNQSNTSYTFSSAEVGATYNYTFSSNGGGTNVTGSGTVASAGQTISGIDLSGLSDGTITLSVTLTDVNGNTGSAATDTETKETIAPTGYSVTINQSPINSGNQSSTSFTFASAEVGATYNYTFSSTGGGTNVTGSGTVASAGQTLSGIDLSGLGDGTITLSATLTDTNGNTGSAATDTETKETVAPTGYSVSIDQSPINSGNQSNASYTFSSAEVGATYNYTFSSTGGGTNVTGSGTVASSGATISGINLSGLGDGTITLSVTLTDVNGNTGSTATDTETKETVAPTGYSVSINQSPIDSGNVTAISYTFSSAEVGATYNYTFSSTGGGTNVTGSGTVASAGQTISGINLSGLGDGTITLSVTLTDVNGNTGSAATDTETKDADAPSGYSVAIDQSPINSNNQNTASYTFSSAEIGATYNYTFSSTGGGTNVTGSGTVTSAGQTISGINLSGLGDGTITLSVTLTDTGGNSGSAATDTETKETVAPTGYTATINQDPINAGNQTAISYTFSGAEVGATYNYTFSSSGGGTNVTGSGVVGSAGATVSGINLSSLNDGTITLSVTLTDINGNTGNAATDTKSKDSGPPTGYTVSWDDSLINNTEATTASFTVSNAEIGTTINNTISSSGDGNTATVSNPITVTSTNQIVTIDVSSLTNGTLTVEVTLTDPGNNTGNTVSDNSATLDKTAPSGYTVAINQSPINTGNQNTVSYTFSSAEVGATYNYTFSSTGGGTNVTGSGVITSTGQTISGIDLSGLGDGTITLSSTLTDPAGNTGSSTTDTETKNTTRPTATVSINDTSLIISETATITITFSEAISGFDNTDLTIPNGTLTPVNSIDGNITFTATFTPSVSTEDATNIIILNNTGYTNNAGNTGLGATNSENFEIDTITPSITSMTISDTNLAAGETGILTIVFSEAISGFDNSDLTLLSGTLSPVTSTDGNITFTATFTPSMGISETGVISLDNTGITDVAGNSGSGTSTTSSITIDTQVPTATISIDDNALSIGETATVTIAFSEAVTGFDNNDLTIPNGMLTSVSSADGNLTFTATYTPTAEIEEDVNIISLDNSGITGTTNTGVGTTESQNFSIDTKTPTSSISISSTDLGLNETALITITFSEAIIGFTNDDLMISNGTISPVSSSDGGITYTTTFTPTEGIVETSNSITLDNSGITDIAGNPGIGNTESENFIINTEEVVIPNISFKKGFSPNGDGINDTWVIEGIENFSNHTIQVFNRSGNKIFEAKDYQNDWDGTSNGNLVFGSDKLPPGPYYFIIDTGDNKTPPNTGWIYINY